MHYRGRPSPRIRHRSDLPTRHLPPDVETPAESPRALDSHALLSSPATLRSRATQRPVRGEESKLSNYSYVVQATTFPIMSGLARHVNSNGELAGTTPSSNIPCAIGPDGDLAEEKRTWPAAL